VATFAYLVDHGLSGVGAGFQDEGGNFEGDEQIQVLEFLAEQGLDSPLECVGSF